MNNPKYEFPDLEWNHCPDWAISLPEFPVGDEIVGRWFIPDESPVIPTGWIYQMRSGERVTQYQLWSRRNQ